MDRLAFIPGAIQRETIEEANGLIFFDRRTALDFANEFLGQQPLLYQTILACMAEGDRVDIKFGLQDPKGPEEEVPSGESVGHTWAIFTEASGKERLLWDVSRESQPIREVDAARAYNAFRAALADHQGVQSPAAKPENHSDSIKTVLPGNQAISRVLSPAHLYEASGVIWFFIDLSMTAPCRADHLSTPLRLSRPMNAFDALILTALVTLACDAPPLVFGVFLGDDVRGKMPDQYRTASYLFAPGVIENENDMIIIG